METARGVINKYSEVNEAILVGRTIGRVEEVTANPSTGENKVDGSLGDAALPLGTNSTILNGLNTSNNLFDEPNSLGNTLVGVVQMETARGVINKYSGVNEAILVGRTIGRVKEVTANRGFQLITEKHTLRGGATSRKVAGVLKVLGNSSGVICFPNLFAELAGCTFGRSNGGGSEETETKLVKEMAESELLSMGKPKMA
jgi:hypothetical protein